MATLTPYRAQILMPEEIREGLRELAHKQRKSQQRLINELILEAILKDPDAAVFVREFVLQLR